MRLIVKLRRSIQKKYFPTPRDLVMRRWKSDAGDQKLRLEYPLNSDSVVMDLGGYRGEWAEEMHRRYGCQIHIFEPVASFADLIEDKFSEVPSVHLYRFGLGGKTREESLCLSADASSVFTPQSHRRDGYETIRIVDIEEWFQQQKYPIVDLMKVNIEGGEYETLERMIETGLTERVRDLQVQFHEIDEHSASRMEAILEGLGSTHVPTYQYRFVWENWRRNAA